MKRNSNAVLSARVCSVVLSTLLSLSATFAFAQNVSDDVPLVLDFSRETLVRTIEPTVIYQTPNSNEKPLAKLRGGQTVWSSRRAKGFSLVYDKYSKKRGWIVDEAVQNAGLTEEQANALARFNQEIDNLLFEANDPLTELKKKIDLEKRRKKKLEQFGLLETPYGSTARASLYEAYHGLGEYKNCQREAEQAFQVLSKYLGQNDMRTVLAKARLAEGVALAQGGISSELFADCLRTTEVLLGQKSLVYLEILASAAHYEPDVLLKIKLRRQAVKIARDLKIEGVQLVEYLIYCGVDLGNSGQPKLINSSVPYFEEAMKLLNGPENKMQLGGCLMSLAQTQNTLGDYGSAQDNLQQAVDIFRAEPETPFAKDKLALALKTLGEVYSFRRNERAAVAVYNEVVELESQYSFDARISLVASLQRLGKAGDANAIARETLAFFNEHSETFTGFGYHSMAQTMLEVGEISDAETLIENGLKRLAPNDGLLKNDFRALKANIKIENGQVDEGLALLQETIDFRIKKLGIENCHYLVHNYADLLLKKGRIEESLKQHTAIYKMRHEKYGDSHNCSQASLMALAELYMAQSKFEEAKESLLVALKAQEGRGRTDFEGI